nr:Atu4866 domain-containing protein [Brucella pituitosa]
MMHALAAVITATLLVHVETGGTYERAYEERYEVTGTHIEYWDDTGFTADGDFIDNVQHYAGMILYPR